MVKESSRDVNIKKKRKSATTADTENDPDFYKKCLEFEEKEASNQPNGSGAETSLQICQEIRQLVKEIGELKQRKDDPESASKISEKASEICLRIVLLKKLNRLEKLRLVGPKEQLMAEKQKVDSINLQYQNLLYEANNLIAEYRKCFQFKSRDEAVDLVSVDEFLLNGPESLTSKFAKFDKEDEAMQHNLRLARLEWELQQRIHLANRCKEMEEEKRKLESDIAERKLKLNKVAPLLANVMEATKPVQEHLGLHVDKTKMEHKLAALLPDPLYLFYTNAEAYRKVNDKQMTVTIVGDQDEASNFKSSRRFENLTVIDEDNEDADQQQSDAELDTQELEEMQETKNRRHHNRKSLDSAAAVIDPLEEQKNKLLQIHPLAVEVKISLRNDGPSVKLKLCFCPKLEIVTTSASVEVPDSLTGNAAREVLSSDNILAELVENDFGLESPNPCTKFQLKKVGISSFRSLTPQLGHAYGWIQQMCGFNFLPPGPELDPANNLSAANAGAASVCSGRNRNNNFCEDVQQQKIDIESVMKTVKSRLKSRYALAKQIEELEKNRIPSISDVAELPKAHISILSKWESTDFHTVCQASHASVFLETKLITENDVIYSAVVTRSNANLHAFVVIKNDYPATTPVFCLKLEYNGRVIHAQNDDNIRDLERSVNNSWTHNNNNNNNHEQITKNTKSSANNPCLLAVQVTFLCVGLDIYLETEYPSTFPQNTMYIKSARARNRRKPFKFRNIGVGVFTQ